MLKVKIINRDGHDPLEEAVNQFLRENSGREHITTKFGEKYTRFVEIISVQYQVAASEYGVINSCMIYYDEKEVEIL